MPSSSHAFAGLAELNHVVLDFKGAEAPYKAGEAAEPVLLHVKGGINFFEFVVNDAQIVHMAVVLADDAGDGLLDLRFGDAGALFLDKVAAVELYHLKIAVVQTF